MRFQERFMETRSEPFEFEGELVHSYCERTLEPGAVIEVEFLSWRQVPPQGIELSVRRAKSARLRWEEHGLDGRSIRLWADKQRRATIRYLNPRLTAEVSIWNVWVETRRGEASYEPPSYEIVQAFWAWSGMRIEESGDEVLLRCSGSYDGPNFDDLAVRIRFR